MQIWCLRDSFLIVFAINSDRFRECMSATPKSHFYYLENITRLSEGQLSDVLLSYYTKKTLDILVNCNFFPIKREYRALTFHPKKHDGRDQRTSRDL
jgi:hypothetical protein